MNKTKFGIIAAAFAALTLALIFVTRPASSPAQAYQEPPPDFAASYKTSSGPADTGGVITYTIVVSNAGGPAMGVTLSDTLPFGLALDACTYTVAGSVAAACVPPLLWTVDLDAGGSVTTTLVEQVTAQTARWPLDNCATLRWGEDGTAGQREMCAATTANPDRVYLPVLMTRWPTWWAEYDWCPGEDVDREGHREDGGNDIWSPHKPTVTIPYTCVGWIHWSRPYGSTEGGPSDSDYYFYEITDADFGRTVRATLTRLPVDYLIFYHYPDPNNKGASYNVGTVDEVLVLPATEIGIYTLKIYSQIFGHDPPIPEYDPVNPYLLTLEWVP
jgi:uncharacterized repeat protein (TIGR01451 family)